MRLAVEQSYQVKGTTYPNPPVGAVILDPEGRVAGVGAPRRPAATTPKWWPCAGPAVWPPVASRWSPSSRATTTARLRRA